jgi:hypothetical protein
LRTYKRRIFFFHLPSAPAECASQYDGHAGKPEGLLARNGLNIIAQHLQTREEIGYVVTDLDKIPSDALLAEMQRDSTFIRTRLLRQGKQREE